MMMITKSAGSGRFVEFDLRSVDSPAFVIDAARLEDNLRQLHAVGEAAGVKILSALKAFSMWSVGDLIGRYCDGVCASGLYEAILADKFYGGHLSVYSPAYKPEDMAALCQMSDHIIVNSLSQLDLYEAELRHAGVEIGMRVNPQIPLGEVAKYDPSAPHSRLGMKSGHMTEAILARIEGLHVHNLCEQGFSELVKTIEAIAPLLARAKGKIKWLNLGGGHLITAADYERENLITMLKELKHKYQIDIYLEPGTAVCFDAGILVGEILDVSPSQTNTHAGAGAQENEVGAIIDISACCHMPDVLEAPYRPALLGEAGSGKYQVRLGGPSCLAGDEIGVYQFEHLPKRGDRLAFLDQAHYSMVKTTMFNGVKHPSIYLWDSRDQSLRSLRTFDYSDFETRLS